MSTENPTDADELRADIERHRDELAADIDQLAAKLDVKAQASRKVHEVADRVEPVMTTAKDNRMPLLIGGTVLVVALVAWRLRSRR